MVRPRLTGACDIASIPRLQSLLQAVQSCKWLPNLTPALPVHPDLVAAPHLSPNPTHPSRWPSDIGGSGFKAMLLTRRNSVSERCASSPARAHPGGHAYRARRIPHPVSDFDRVSVGFPGTQARLTILSTNLACPMGNFPCIDTLAER